MAFNGVRTADLEFSRGGPKFYASSDIAERGFCADCGTPLTYRLMGRDRISVTICSLDKPAAVRPTEQVGVESTAPWFESLAGLPAERTEAWLTAENVGPVGSHQHPDFDR